MSMSSPTSTPTSLLFLLCLYLSLQCMVVNIVRAFQCEFEADSATFDICELELTAESGIPFYEVYDDRDEYQLNFTYVFNVAGNVLSSPYVYGSTVEQMCVNSTLRALDGKVLGPCDQSYINETGHDCLDDRINEIDRLTAVYQMHRHVNNHDCFRLHDGLTEPQFELINELDPSEGFRLIYRNGDWCPVFGRNREFEINFMCADIIENVPDKEETILEDAEEEEDAVGCYYIMEYISTFGCPLECPVVEAVGSDDRRLRLCGGNGRCSFDETNQKPMCFCYTGYYGDDCTMTSDPFLKVKQKENDEGWVGALVVIVSVLTCSVFVILYLLKRIYTTKVSTMASKTGRQMGMNISDGGGIVSEEDNHSSHYTGNKASKKQRNKGGGNNAKQATLLDDEEPDVVIS